MKILQLPFIFIVFLLVGKNAFSGSRYWIGGTGNWNDPSHWSGTDGGASDFTLPTSSDDVYFTSNSGTGILSLNTDATVYRIYGNTSSSSITLDIPTSYTLTVSNIISIYPSSNLTVLMSGGILNASGISSYGGIFQANSGTVTINGALSSFYIDGGTTNFAGATININNTSSLRVLSGILNISGGTINVTDYFDISGGSCTYSNATTTVIGRNYISYGGTMQFNSGTLSIGTYSTIYGSASSNLTMNGGTINIGTDLGFQSGTNNLSGGTITTGGNFNVSGGTVNSSGTTINVGDGVNEELYLSSGTLTISSGTINVKDDFYINSGTTFSISGGTVNLGVGGAPVYATTFYCGTAGTFSGGVIDVQFAKTTAINISSTSSFTGGLMKVSATNVNYNLLTRKAYNLLINSAGKTATLTTSMIIYGDFTVTAGTFTASTGTTTFNGSIAQNILGTSATAITFYNVTLNNSNGLTIAPSSGIATTVKYTLTLTSGKITLGNYTLNIGTTGVSGSISGGSSSNYIITNGTGVLKQYNVGTGQRTSVFYPIGISSTSYTPITLAVSGASTVDDFSVRVSQNVLINGTSGSAYTDDCVDRTWNISEGTAGGSSVTISPQWNGSEEFASFIRSTAYIGHYTGGVWTTVTTGTVTGSNPYTCTSAAITSFSPFAVFDPILLPNDEVTFEVIPNGNKVNISWTTTTEVNCDYYTIKKSSDGIHFVDVDEVEQTGNPYVSKQYYSLDEQPFLGISYYQLNQFDTDGNIIYSSIKSVNFKNQQNSILYPNPVSDGVIHLSLNEFKGNLEISIFDNGGKLVYYQTAKDKENSIITIDLNDEFSNGIYQVQISNEYTTEHHKLYVH